VLLARHAPDQNPPSVKGESWLLTSVPETNRIAAFSNSLRRKARSLPKWNCPSRPITTLSKSFFRTRPLSRSTSNRVCRSLLRLSVGSLVITNRRNDGDLFTAFKPDPPEMAGFLFGCGQHIGFKFFQKLDVHISGKGSFRIEFVFCVGCISARRDKERCDAIL
jgi:hypothetical protein